MSRPTTRRLTRSRSAAFLTAFALVAVGCAPEDTQQEAAREEVQAHVRALGPTSGYDDEDVHCTDAHGVWFREEQTDEFTCAVRIASRAAATGSPCASNGRGNV